MFSSLTQRIEWILEHPDQAPPGIIPFANQTDCMDWMLEGDRRNRHRCDTTDPQYRDYPADGPLCVIMADQLTGDDLYPVEAQVMLNEDRIECVAMERIK
jgi:hypothetical protein